MLGMLGTHLELKEALNRTFVQLICMLLAGDIDEIFCL